MKLSLALVSAALAASASAVPVRIIALSSPPQYLPADAVHPSSDDNAAAGIPQVAAPCHGTKDHSPQGMVIPPGPIGALMARLGITSPEARPHAHRPHHGDHSDERWEVVSALHEKEAAHQVFKSWREYIEEMAGPTRDRVLPIIEGGSVRILPVDMTGHVDQAAPHRHHADAHAGWKSLEGSNGVKKHHHHHGHGFHAGQPRSFVCRLGRALRSLSPTEATALMFVLGAGIGSLLHLVFAMVFITVRVLRGKRGSCAARRAARREARRVRKDERRVKKAGGIRLEGEEHDEVLPSYAEGETDRLVEKA